MKGQRIRIFFKGPKYSEEYLVVRERATIRTKRPSVSKPVTYGSHVPIGQQKTMVSVIVVKKPRS